MRRVQRVGAGQTDQPGTSRHYLRIQTGPRREIQPHHQSRRRPVSGVKSRVCPHRPHPGQIYGRHRSPELPPRDDQIARGLGVEEVSRVEIKTDARAGEDYRRGELRGRSDEDAAPADSRRTGAGKSVALNTILTSMLYKANPEEVKFILIDPKRLELGLYADIPHLLSPIVTDPKRASYALKWAVAEMESRYKRLASFGVRNIEQYNAEAESNSKRVQESIDDEEAKPLPYIVVIIDELADLMMVSARDVEESITRLAQMARAVGIHLVLATQRPSVDVITGLIKANFPSRISFRVSSKVDSRTIIDTNGAEQLLGQGDMLFLPPGTSRLVRVHGAYIDEKEVKRIADFVRSQG